MATTRQETERLPFGWKNKTGELEKSASFAHFEHDSGTRLYVRPNEVVAVLPHFKRTFVRASRKNGLEFWKGVYPLKGVKAFEENAEPLNGKESDEVVRQLRNAIDGQLGLSLKNKRQFESFYNFLKLVDAYKRKG